LLDALPLTPNGKVNQRALPMPEGLRPELEVAYVAPRNALEQAIAAIWCEVLRVEQVGMNDNFFDLGGHSLLIVQAHSKLRVLLESDISLIDLFKYPTVSALAAHLRPQQDDQPAAQSSADRTLMRRDAAKRQKDARQRHRTVKKP